MKYTPLPCAADFIARDEGGNGITGIDLISRLTELEAACHFFTHCQGCGKPIERKPPPLCIDCKVK